MGACQTPLMKTDTRTVAPDSLERQADLTTIRAFPWTKVGTITAIVGTTWPMLRDLWPAIAGFLDAAARAYGWYCDLVREWVLELSVGTSLMLIGVVAALYAVAMFVNSGNDIHFRETLMYGAALVTVALVVLTGSWPPSAAAAIICCWLAPFALYTRRRFTAPHQSANDRQSRP